MKALEWAGMGGGVDGVDVVEGGIVGGVKGGIEDMGRGLALVCPLFLPEISE
jgi:hypothetical protein